MAEANSVNPVIEFFSDADITDAMPQEASALFSSHYGIWSRNEQCAEQLSSRGLIPGSRVRLSPTRLHKECLPDVALSNTCIRASINGTSVGHALVCRYYTGCRSLRSINSETVCWITQLVVHRDYREKGIATSLVKAAKNEKDDLYGITSSHPAALLAAQRAFGDGNVYLCWNEDLMFRECPVPYLHGRKYGLPTLNTEFYVDHRELLEVLARVRAARDWRFGDLLEGHEFVFVSVS